MPEHLQRMYTVTKENNADVIHNNRIRVMLPLENGTIPTEMFGHPESVVMCKAETGERVTGIQALPACVFMPGSGYVYRFNETSATKVANTVTRIINALGSQLEVIKSFREISGRIPFLKDEANFTAAVNTILAHIEGFTLRIHYQEAGQERLRNDENVCVFFREEFSEKASCVEFLFYQLHETYPELPKSFLFDRNVLEDIKHTLNEAKAAGKEFIIERK